MKIFGIITALFFSQSVQAAEWLHCGQIIPESVQIAPSIQYVNGGQLAYAPALSVMYSEVTPFYMDDKGKVTSYDSLKAYKSGPYYYLIKDYDDAHQALVFSTMQIAAQQPWVCLTRGKYVVYLRTGATIVEAIRAEPLKP